MDGTNERSGRHCAKVLAGQQRGGEESQGRENRKTKKKKKTKKEEEEEEEKEKDKRGLHGRESDGDSDGAGKGEEGIRGDGAHLASTLASSSSSAARCMPLDWEDRDHLDAVAALGPFDVAGLSIRVHVTVLITAYPVVHT